MVPDASSHLRIARPSRDLHGAERFWFSVLRPDVLWRTILAAAERLSAYLDAATRDRLDAALAVSA